MSKDNQRENERGRDLTIPKSNLDDRQKNASPPSPPQEHPSPAPSPPHTHVNRPVSRICFFWFRDNSSAYFKTRSRNQNSCPRTGVGPWEEGANSNETSSGLLTLFVPGSASVLQCTCSNLIREWGGDFLFDVEPDLTGSNCVDCDATNSRKELHDAVNCGFDIGFATQ